ncbi:MAG: PAS-domain containing protein [Sediminimonas sp.]|uniref:PAS-domain containing protein n=1 Tax=Sediminimonas sp. TaxID=2823379 RepID=UPI002870015F|nr:PAS-domain containing protein [Sediminimonas sp.]MDR9484687.1 PAS-domain containing protein [Sediminimonas sp.]
MTYLPISQLLGTVAIGGCTAIVAFWLTSWRERRAGTGRRALLKRDENATCFLFDDTTLLDSTPPAAALFASVPGGNDNDWARLRRALAPRFPSFPGAPDAVRAAGHLDIPTSTLAAHAHVTAEWHDGVIRVCLMDECADAPLSSVGRHHLQILESEMTTLQQAVQNTPYPVWQVSNAGTVTWANRAYRTLADRLGVDDQAQPNTITPLFDLPDQDADTSTCQRVSLTAGDQVHWFDVSSTRVNGGHMHYATDVNAVVNAEIAQRNFVQTLAKTFAQLSTGLAIFDRSRRLALFNPALTNLTGLSAEFLSARPDLLTMFDQMRELQMMPEPRNYATWREEISDVIAAASDGRYQETWSLPSGLTYRVTGRPHPDGAIAFLFEDISAEVASTRRYRAQLELGQSMMNHLDQAVAVFSPSGVLDFCNAPYRDLWATDPDSSFAEMTLTDCITLWRQKCGATPAWTRMQAYFSNPGATTDWRGEVRLASGDMLACHVAPLSHGATMVAFRRTQAASIRDLAQIPG